MLYVHGGMSGMKSVTMGGGYVCLLGKGASYGNPQVCTALIIIIQIFQNWV
jgi:hypothetical protein